MPIASKSRSAASIAYLNFVACCIAFSSLMNASADDGIAEVQAAFGGRTSDGSGIKVAVAIKGGGSLGTYEAGVSWGLLRILKRFEASGGQEVDLLAAAGASAGAFNGVMSAVYWCGKDLGLDTIDANVISDSWRGVDIKDLLDLPDAPEPLLASKGLFDGECAQDAQQQATEGQTEDNGIFSRRVFRRTQDTLQCMMEKPVFRAGCSVSIGLTLTRADAVRNDSAGIEVSNQRLVVPLRMAEADGGRFSAHRLPLETDNLSFNRNIIHLDGGDDDNSVDGKVDSEVVFQAVKGSSSFPMAFAPIKLDYCLRYRTGDTHFLQNYKSSGYDGRCPDEFRRLTSYFVDGGVFDNDPIGVVRHLAEDGGAAVGDVLYVNIDPGRRRQSRGIAKLKVTPFNQPGDSIEVELQSGRARLQPEGRDASSHAIVVVCDDNETAVTQFELPLYETGPQQLRYMGVLHTCDDCVSDGVLPTQVGQQIRLFPHDSPVAPHCVRRSGRERIWYVESSTVDEEPQGLSTQLGFIADSVESGRNAALYAEIVGQSWADGMHSDDPIASGERPLFQPARLTPLAGEFLASFGAFLERRFRDFDYYAGVYDAVYGVSEFYCNSKGSMTEACLSRTFRNLYFDALCPLCAEEAMPSNVVIHHLVNLDMCGIKSVVDPDLPCNVSQTPWSWVDSIEDSSLSTVSSSGCDLGRPIRLEPELTVDLPAGVVARNELLAIGRALACAEVTEKELDRDPFRAFVQQLALDPRFNRDKETTLGRMLAKSDRPAATWYYPLASATVKKLLPLESRDQELRTANNGDLSVGSSEAKTGLALMGLAAESMMADRIGWQSHLSSIPKDSKWDKYAPFLPNEIAADTRNGGLGVYWEAGWRSHSPWGAIIRGAPYLRQSSNIETVEFSEVSGFLTYSTNDAFLSSGGIGPTYTYTWSDLSPAAESSNWGASAYIGLLGDKLRLTYGVRAFPYEKFDGDGIYWQLSVRDIPGFIYWGLQAQ